jgi:hypothetical protein
MALECVAGGSEVSEESGVVEAASWRRSARAGRVIASGSSVTGGVAEAANLCGYWTRNPSRSAIVDDTVLKNALWVRFTAGPDRPIGPKELMDDENKNVGRVVTAYDLAQGSGYLPGVDAGRFVDSELSA